ncbi:MAG TPA: DUF4169 family protein [Hyphomicrobium sp.]|nr:DUF4169 family protein [Hyphomicrobium sp.]
MTADIVNLNKFRKARERAEAEKLAETNRVRFGRTREEKDIAASEERAKERSLDNAKLPQRGVAIDDDLDPGSVS